MYYTTSLFVVHLLWRPLHQADSPMRQMSWIINLTSLPASMVCLSFLPSSVPDATMALSISPVARWHTQYCSARRGAWEGKEEGVVRELVVRELVLKYSAVNMTWNTMQITACDSYNTRYWTIHVIQERRKRGEEKRKHRGVQLIQYSQPAGRPDQKVGANIVLKF